MRHLTAAVMVLAMAFTVNSYGGEIQATIKKEGTHTIVSCAPRDIEGDIVKAIITLYKSDGNTISVTREEMDVTSHRATYILPDGFLEVGGKCKTYISKKNIFSLTSEYPPASDVIVARADFYTHR